MNRFDRQERIAGWDQHRLSAASVVVHGRDWLGTWTVWALSSLGVGSIAWTGRPSARTESFASWLLANPPDPNCFIQEYPSADEYDTELEWVLDSSRARVVLSCEDDPASQSRYRVMATRKKLLWLGASVGQGGWFGRGAKPVPALEPQDPVPAMAVAGVLVDAARQVLCPLPGDLFPVAGGLHLPRLRPLESPESARPAVVVGVGAIGTYLATALAARGEETQLVDFDRVEVTNRNRQGLYTAEDARDEVEKATAAAAQLRALFPGVRVTAEVRRVEAEYGESLAARSPPPVLVSAVDNARTRLVLQDLGWKFGLPVVHGGTGNHAADCYVQQPGGRLLDEQMHGVLSVVRDREVQSVGGARCAVEPSYVVPGVTAGAMLAQRFVQVCAGERGLRPIRWRSGEHLKEEGTGDDFNFS